MAVSIVAAAVREVADRARVDAAPDRLEFVDDLHGADLRRAGHGAGREAGAEDVERRGPRSSPSTWLTMWSTWLYFSTS
jgi:hypothetical protein